MTELGSAARLLITGFRPGRGGIGRVMMNLIDGFARSAIDVHVLVGPGDYPELNSAKSRARVHQMELGFGARAAERLRRFLRDLAPLAVLSNRDESSALMVAAAAQMPDRPRVSIRVGCNVPAKLLQQNPVSRWRRRRELVSIYRDADLLIGNSKGVCDGLRELLGSVSPPIVTIYNPLDVECARSLAVEPPDHAWFRDRVDPLLISVGRLSRIKDQATLLRAFALLPRDVRLVVFGDGPQRDRLLVLADKLGVADRFDLPGHTDNPFSYLARADAFVLSSIFEGSPNALIESLAVGTPAVSTDCQSGPREILGEGLYGAMAPVGDYRALARAIEGTLEEPPAAALLEEAVSRFDLDSAVGRYLQAMGLPGDGSPAKTAPPRPGVGDSRGGS